jgi:histidinol-phosphatase (PHP family)
MVNSAKAKGFKTLSITEHISQFLEPRNSIQFGSVHQRGHIFSSFEDYLLEFERLDDREFRLNKGLEVDYIARSFAEISSFVKQKNWDFLLLSVHVLSDNKDVETKGLAKDNVSSGERWSEYIQLEKAALKSEEIPFKVLTHPVRLGQGTPSTPSNMDELLLELAELANQTNKALELNGKDLATNYDLVERLAKACSLAGCTMSFGSDAHHPNEIGRNCEKANELIQKFDLKEIQDS